MTIPLFHNENLKDKIIKIITLCKTAKPRKFKKKLFENDLYLPRYWLVHDKEIREKCVEYCNF
jgi:hypothetical protein